MSFTRPEFPPVEPEKFVTAPLMERIRLLTQHWTEHGFGSPRMVHAVYIAKLVLFYALGGVVVATVTSGLPAFWHFAGWWNQPMGGDIMSGANDIRQLTFGPRITLLPYRTGVPGMYLCSAATPPGPGAHGMCGANAVAVALAELGRR
jgi:hypothetical protein